MFQRLGDFVSRRWWLIIALWAGGAIGLHLVAPRWNDVTHDGDLAYLPADLPSAVGERAMARAFPNQRAKSNLAIIVERSRATLSAHDLAWSDSLAERFRQRQDELGIVEVINRNTDVVGEKLTSRAGKNGQAVVTLLELQNEFMAVGNIKLLQEVQTVLNDARRDAPPGLVIGLTGSAAVGGDMLASAAESLRRTELTTVLLVIVILLAVYRSPLLVAVPLVAIGVSVVVSTDLLALLTRANRVPGWEWWNFKVFTTTRIFIVVLLFGAGTDFCLFLIARYREVLEQGAAPAQAVAEAVARVADALIGSAMTTVCGLAMMYFADFGKFRNSGPAIAICLLVALVACLTLAPALLLATGRRIFWPSAIARATTGTAVRAESGASQGFWNALADLVVRRPGTILVVSLIVMAPLAVYGFDVRLTYDFLNELADDRPSVEGAKLIRRHFAAGELGPVTVLAHKQGGQLEDKDGERAISRLTKQLYDMPGVASVRSIAEPLGDKPGVFQPFSSRGRAKLIAIKHKRTEARFLTQVPELKGEVARFDLVLASDPFSPQAIETLNHVDRSLHELRLAPDSPWQGATFTLGGTTVGIRDLERVTRGDQRLIQLLVVAAVLAVLLVLLRRPWTCVYLVASVLLTYYVTMGISQLFFQALYGDTYYGLDWKVPIFVFVILIAVGEDYNIYLVTRVIEEQRLHGPMAGLRLAVARTGGIITSCGVIMAGTFISMVTGTLRGMVELGFALSLGVLLDTCVVRPVLVPAFLALMERWGPGRGAGTSTLDEAPQSGQPMTVRS